jgi:hypothetical protein
VALAGFKPVQSFVVSIQPLPIWVCFQGRLRNKGLSGSVLALFSSGASQIKNLVALFWVCFGFVFYVNSLIARHLVALFTVFDFFLTSQSPVASF